MYGIDGNEPLFTFRATTDVHVAHLKRILFKYLLMKLIILFGKNLCGEPNPFCVYKVVEFPAKGTRTSIMNGITLWCLIPIPSANLFWKIFPVPTLIKVPGQLILEDLVCKVAEARIIPPRKSRLFCHFLN